MSFPPRNYPREWRWRAWKNWATGALFLALVFVADFDGVRLFSALNSIAFFALGLWCESRAKIFEDLARMEAELEAAKARRRALQDQRDNQPPAPPDAP